MEEELVDTHCFLQATFHLTLIFRTPQIKQLEYKGRNILKKLFEAFMENYTGGKSASNSSRRNWKRPFGKSRRKTGRLLGDYLSSLSDAACIRIYRRLFDPPTAPLPTFT